MPEFTVVLNDHHSFDIFIDGERCYFDFTPDDLKAFSIAFALTHESEEQS